MVKNLKPLTNIFQLNTHKSIASLSTLIDAKFTENNNIALIQEPPLGPMGARGYPSPLTCLQTSTNPRAIIIHNPSLDIWQIPHLSDRDCQTSIWRNETHKKPIIIISPYWDITLDTIPDTLEKAIIEAKRKKYDMLIGIDSNSHHPAWGSPETNQRGTLMEKFISLHNLHILNTGAPTFIRINCATHIDLTISTNTLLPKIKNWEVLAEDMLSDHLCLHTSLDKTTKHTKQIRSFKKANWDHFTALLRGMDWPNFNFTNASDIDAATKTLTENITNTIENITPKIYITGSHIKDRWWTEELRLMRRKLRVSSNNTATQTNSQYQSLRTAYRRAIRKAKREGWQSFTDKCVSISDTSKLTRIITKNKNPPPCLTAKPDGTPTWSGPSSTLNIMQTLFPDSSTTAKNETINYHPNTNPIDTSDWINTQTITSIIKSIQPYKAPGPDGITGKMLKHLPPKVISFLVNLYHNIIQLSYIPTNWCKSRAIFIPKSNKTNKNDPKAYRPICLSNTLFKILEKLIQNFLEKSTFTCIT